jgi:6-pyruvoyltetrahydropterin/6-carboxytetrahydropterin synthase
MYQLSVELDFDAAHFLRGYKGKCEAMHGHRFRVLAKVRALASGLNEIGMVYDFAELKRHLGDTISRFDHACLNYVPPFDAINPSSENIASTIYEEFKLKLADAPVLITSIEVWESPQSGASYSPD